MANADERGMILVVLIVGGAIWAGVLLVDFFTFLVG